LPLPVHIHALDGGSRRLFGIGVGKDHDRIFTAEFEADPLEARGRFLSNVAAGRYRTDKANAVHIRMPHQRGPDKPVAGDDIYDPIGKHAFAQFPKTETRQRRLL
jgi:hypothetical protein